MNPRRWYAVGALLVIAALAAFFYVWWTQGDLPAYVARVYSVTPIAIAPEGVQEPTHGTYQSHTETSITLTQPDGAPATYPLKANVAVYRGLGQGASPITLSDINAGMTLVLMFNTEADVEAVYILQN